jgi:hypothetical protein
MTKDFFDRTVNGLQESKTPIDRVQTCSSIGLLHVGVGVGVGVGVTEGVGVGVTEGVGVGVTEGVGVGVTEGVGVGVTEGVGVGVTEELDSLSCVAAKKPIPTLQTIMTATIKIV